MEKIRRENAQDHWQKKVRALTDEVIPLRKMKEEFKVLKTENTELWRKVEQMQALLRAVQLRANDAVELAVGGVDGGPEPGGRESRRGAQWTPFVRGSWTP